MPPRFGVSPFGASAATAGPIATAEAKAAASVSRVANSKRSLPSEAPRWRCLPPLSARRAAREGIASRLFAPRPDCRTARCHTGGHRGLLLPLGLFVEPHRFEGLVDVVARADLPAFHVRL